MIWVHVVLQELWELQCLEVGLLASLPEVPHSCLRAPHAVPPAVACNTALLVQTTAMLALRQMHAAGSRSDSSGMHESPHYCVVSV